jgi:hypothetical protein
MGAPPSQAPSPCSRLILELSVRRPYRPCYTRASARGFIVIAKTGAIRQASIYSVVGGRRWRWLRLYTWAPKLSAYGGGGAQRHVGVGDVLRPISATCLSDVHIYSSALHTLQTGVRPRQLVEDVAPSRKSRSCAYYCRALWRRRLQSDCGALPRRQILRGRRRRSHHLHQALNVSAAIIRNLLHGCSHPAYQTSHELCGPSRRLPRWPCSRCIFLL